MRGAGGSDAWFCYLKWPVLFKWRCCYFEMAKKSFFLPCYKAYVIQCIKQARCHLPLWIYFYFIFFCEINSDEGVAVANNFV